MSEISFGEWLKRQRSGKGLTQAQLAQQIGCAVVTLRKIESEERRPSAQIIERIAQIFNIPETEQASFLKYARGDWSYAPGESIRETPWLTPTPPRSNIPVPITSFIGRGNEVKDVTDLLAKNRLVTLVGPPGIGKTRLSVEVARQSLEQFPGGVFFAGLAPLNDPLLIAPTIVQSLGYVESEKLSATQQLLDGIGDKHMLILLDNCEHLIQRIAALASELLSGCSHLKILATSRESLRVTGEWLFVVPILDAPRTASTINLEDVSKFPALMLFAERARAVRSDFALNPETLPPVASICTHLDGLPLAIELISAQMRLHSPQSLLERWNDQFVLSAEGSRNAPARHISLSHAIRWSYDSLAPDEQKLLACLSVFSGGFTLSAAEAIFSGYIPGASISDVIASLLDKSLLQRSSGSHDEVRFMMLVTIQQFALNCLRQMGEEEQVRDRHLAYFLDFAEQADQQIHGPDQLKWMDSVEDELDNFRAALHWCVSSSKTEPAMNLLISLSATWVRRDHSQEMRTWFRIISSLSGIRNSPILYARLLNHLSQHCWSVGDFDYAKSLLEESHAILVKLGIEGERDLAMNLGWLGMVAHTGEADIEKARLFYERSFELYKKYGDQWGMAFVVFNSGVNADEWNDNVSALSLFEQSLEWFRQLGDIWGMGRARQCLGQSFLKQGNYEKARIHFEEHLKMDQGLRFKQGTMIALQNLGNLYRYQGDYEQAIHFYERSLSLSGEYGASWESSNSLWYLGVAALHQNDYQRARQYFLDYYTLAREIYTGGIGECDFLTAMAAVTGGTNHPERAAKLNGAAQALFEMSDYRLAPFDRAEFNRHIQIAQNQLGGSKFEELMAVGYAMTMEQAVADALEA